MTTDEKREKVFLAVLDYAYSFYEDKDGKPQLASSEGVYQSDSMQIEGLELICKLLDILNDKG